MTTHQARGRVDLLDYLRLLAALVVVFHHWVFNGVVNGKISSLHQLTPAADVAKYGYLGVTLFFLVSGFVIYGSVAGKTPDTFAVGRAVRLYPAFWAGLGVTTLVSLAWGGGRFPVAAPELLANLTMVPTAFGQPLVDGVYWTLAYELVFYVAIFLAMAAGLSDRLHRLLPMWAILMFAILIIAPRLGDKPFLGTYYAYFAAGAIIATFRRDGVTWLSGAGLAAACWVSVQQSIGHVDALERETGVAFSRTVVVVATLAFFGVLVALSFDRVRAIRLPKAAVAGALTYPVYLLHAHVGYIALSHLATPSNAWFVYACLLAALLLAAYAVHVLVERWPRTFWFRTFDATAGRAVRAGGDLVRRRPARGRLAGEGR